METATQFAPTEVIRAVTQDDLAFVRETAAKIRWARTGITWRDHFAAHGPLIDQWLSAGQAVVVELDGVLLGFAIVSDGIVRCAYVKLGFRGQRYALQMLAALGISNPLKAYLPTPSFRAWARHHKLDVTAVS